MVVPAGTRCRVRTSAYRTGWAASSGLAASGLAASGLVASELVASWAAASGYWMTSSTIRAAAVLSDAGWSGGADG